MERSTARTVGYLSKDAIDATSTSGGKGTPALLFGSTGWGTVSVNTTSPPFSSDANSLRRRSFFRDRARRNAMVPVYVPVGHDRELLDWILGSSEGLRLPRATTFSCAAINCMLHAIR